MIIQRPKGAGERSSNIFESSCDEIARETAGTRDSWFIAAAWTAFATGDDEVDANAMPPLKCVCVSQFAEGPGNLLRLLRLGVKWRRRWILRRRLSMD